MSHRRWLGLAAACALGTMAAGCGAPADPTADRVVDVEAGVRALNRALGLSTAFIAVGVINPMATPSSIAVAIQNRFQGETGTCAPSTVMGDEIDADVTAGCTLASSGMIVTGRIHVGVTKDSGGIHIAIVPDLTLDGGQAFKGTFNVHTDNGNSFDYDGDLTLAGTRVVAPFVRLGIGNFGSITGIDGTVTGKSAVAHRLDSIGVFQGFSNCYPEEGPVRVTGPGVDETYTFSNETPRTGLATVTPKTTGVPRSIALPARTGCPRK